TICLTTGIISQATRKELFGVIAHEMGHLMNGDSVIMQIAAIMNSIGTWATWGITGIILILGRFVDGFVPGVKWIIVAEVWVLKGIAWLAFKLLDVGMKYTSRQSEYVADKFAAQVGYRDGLVAFLWRVYGRPKLEGIREQFSFQDSFIAALTDTHPPVVERLRALGVEVD
ncbi:MAG: M48 family metalloprotease, partial [Candidatus Methanomethyliaceae archaeon]